MDSPPPDVFKIIPVINIGFVTGTKYSSWFNQVEQMEFNINVVLDLAKIIFILLIVKSMNCIGNNIFK